jgi:hypothetical protein
VVIGHFSSTSVIIILESFMLKDLAIPVKLKEKLLKVVCNKHPLNKGKGYGVYHHYQQYFSYIVAVSFIGGGNRSTQRKPATCRKSLTNFITKYCTESTSP